MKTTKIIPLIIERENKSGLIWGRTEYDNDLMADSANSLDELIIKMDKLLLKVSGIRSDEFVFELVYDLSAFFTEKSYLNLSAIAERTGINRSLLAQYASGIKFPSVDRAEEIEKAINGFGHELAAVKLALRGKPLTTTGTSGFTTGTTLNETEGEFIRVDSKLSGVGHKKHKRTL